MIKEISGHVSTIKSTVDAMIASRKAANKLEDARERAVAYCDDIKEKFAAIRRASDKLELLVADEDWPLVKYRELLFRH
jgi:glutamine synthetase